MTDDADYKCDIISEEDFSLDVSSNYPAPVPAQPDKELPDLPIHLEQNTQATNQDEKMHDKWPVEVKEPKELKGTVLKKRSGEWKDRFVHVRPDVRALFYYESLSKATKNAKPLGVYPLIGAAVSDLHPIEAEESFLFTLSLRTGQKITFKLLDRKHARQWRSALRDTIMMPCDAPSEGAAKGECILKSTVLNKKRAIVLDYSSGYFYAYKKTDELKPTEKHQLKSSVIIPQKSFDSTFDVVVESGKDYKKEYSFKDAKEWAKWCIQLEAMVNRMKHN